MAVIPKEFIEVWIGLTKGDKYTIEGDAETIDQFDIPCIFDSDDNKIWIGSHLVGSKQKISINF